MELFGLDMLSGKDCTAEERYMFLKYLEEAAAEESLGKV